MPTKEFQSSFNTGVMSKKAQSRVKIARYQAGLKTCEHAIVLPVGGVTRRPGFRFAKETKDSATQDSVLIPYDAGADFTFMLEFGDLFMRVFNQDGSQVNTIGGPELIINGGFPTDILSWIDVSTGTGIFEWNPDFLTAWLQNPAIGDTAYMEQAIATTIGQTYQIALDVTFNATGDFTFRVGTTTGGAEVGETILGSGSHVLQFIASATTTYIGFKQDGITENLGPEGVLNGEFNDNILNWTNESTGAGAVSWVAGQLRTDSGLESAAGQRAGAYQGVPAIIGKEYQVLWDFINNSHDSGGSSEIRIGTTPAGNDIFSKSYTTGGSAFQDSTIFTATTTTVYLTFRAYRGGVPFFEPVERSSWDNVSMHQRGYGVLVDNVSVKLADTPFELVTTIPLAELQDLQYAQLENGMQLVSDGVKLQFLQPSSPSVWTITEEDWKDNKAIPGGTGTNIGDMSSGGGLAAAFDGDTLKAAAACAQGAAGGLLSHIGKDWGVGVSKIIKGANVFSSSATGFWNEVGVELIFRVQGSDDNFAAQTVNLAEFIVTSSTTLKKLEIFNLNDTRTGYRYHRIEIQAKSDSGVARSSVAELEFFELVAENPPGLNDLTTTYAPAIGRFQQRSITGGQKGRPATVYGSQSGDPFNMGEDDAADADAFRHELDSTSSIRWFLDSDGLLIGTSHGVTRMIGTQGPLSPSDKLALADVAVGCAPILPAKMGNSALYIQTDRQRLQEVTIPPNGVKLAVSDLSQLADHIGDEALSGSKFKGCAAQSDPNKVLWCYHDDGRLSGVTFDRQESLFGWHTHPMANAEVISLKPLRGVDGRTEIWAIIKRTINGATKRSIEIMDPEVYSDGAVKYSGVPATTITGLDHLEGETVTVYGDGYFRGTFVVTGGQIGPLEETMAAGDIGLAFTPKIQPVTPLRGLGRKRRFGPVLVEVENTQSLWVNGKRQSFRKGSDPMGAGVNFTGKKRVTVLGWSRDPTLTFEAREPGPWTILNYSGDMETGR